MSKNLMDDVFDQSNLSAREQVTEWVKLKEKLGTRVAGTFLGYWEKPAEGVYRRQISVALADFESPEKVYGVTLPDYFEKDLMKYQVGDRCGAEYYKDIPPKEPGVSATKAVRLFNLDLKAREKGKTVAEVQKEDAAKVPSDDEQPF